MLYSVFLSPPAPWLNCATQMQTTVAGTWLTSLASIRQPRRKESVLTVLKDGEISPPTRWGSGAAMTTDTRPPMFSIAPSTAPVLSLRVPQLLLRLTPNPPRRLQSHLENLPGPSLQWDPRGVSLTRLFF